MKLIGRNMTLLFQGKIKIGNFEVPVTDVDIKIERRSAVAIVAKGIVTMEDFPRVFGKFRYAPRNKSESLLDNTVFTYHDHVCGIKSVEILDSFTWRYENDQEYYKRTGHVLKQNKFEKGPKAPIHFRADYKVIKVYALVDDVCWEDIMKTSITSGEYFDPIKYEEI